MAFILQINERKIRVGDNTLLFRTPKCMAVVFWIFKTFLTGYCLENFETVSSLPFLSREVILFYIAGECTLVIST